jgi:hypothetical protein
MSSVLQKMNSTPKKVTGKAIELTSPNLKEKSNEKSPKQSLNKLSKNKSVSKISLSRRSQRFHQFQSEIHSSSEDFDSSQDASNKVIETEMNENLRIHP